MQIHRRLSRAFHMALVFSFIFGFFTVLQAPSAQAQNQIQTRVSDHDMEALMTNLHQDAKSFRPDFDAALNKSTIRHTSAETDARDQAAAFQRETEGMLHHFKKNPNSVRAFGNAMDTAEQIDAYVDRLTLDPRVTDKWQKIRTELHEIAQAYGVPERFHRRDMNNGPGDR